MLFLGTIKQILTALGVNDLAIKFDRTEGQIIVTYDYAKKRYSKNISFIEVENLFLGSQGADSSIESPHPDKPA
jgi:hypothetical protein